ncbi:MAG: N-6 DNA methylase [Peptococcaceae bacterium]|nr:N-6 DNA methylase [Peptococcaceae bacterium]
MENKLLRRVEDISLKEAVWKLKNKTRALASVNDDYYNECVAFALLLEMKNPDKDATSLKDFLEELQIETEISQFILKTIENDWDVIRTFKKDFNYEELLACLLFGDEEDYFKGRTSGLSVTPRSLSALALRILEIESDNKVLDLCSGQGNFLMHAMAANENAEYHGIEINANTYRIAKMKSLIAPGKVSFSFGDALNVKTQEKYDKIFSHYPYKMFVPEYVFEQGVLLDIFGDVVKRVRKSSSDWLFNLSMISLLSDSGKGISVMIPASITSGSDKKIRKYFIDNGFIEAVISLPAGLEPSTSISLNFVVFSHGNKDVTFIDAKDIYKKTGVRKSAVLTEENIAEIVTLLRNGGDKAVRVSNEKIAETEYNLNPVRYLDPIYEIDIKNAVAFETVIKSVNRGAQISPDFLDEYMSPHETDIQYVPLGSIRNNVFEPDDMPQYLKEVPEKMDNFIIKNNMLLITRAGNAIKTAVATVEENKIYIGSGNLLLVELDETKINPYYLQAFFMSDIGSAVLNSNASSNGALMTLQLPQLKALPIPLIPLEEQKEIADKCLAANKEYVYYKAKLAAAQDRMNRIYEGD